ncbi:hypothetical protein EBBID32_20430 [Sphingobium indicum BiD32]|uniref:Uncharacterized protein n=1 Tax=Sphingobium indicum BiD32 TaxID=1301087 RepID=N1MKF5_9SPHN|nr:hypothetical protein EBBID32_20430 [Sphingobium indicum BiD32]
MEQAPLREETGCRGDRLRFVGRARINHVARGRTIMGPRSAADRSFHL